MNDADTKFWEDIADAARSIYQRKTQHIRIVHSEGSATAMLFDPRIPYISNAILPKESPRVVHILLSDTRYTK